MFEKSIKAFLSYLYLKIHCHLPIDEFRLMVRELCPLHYLGIQINRDDVCRCKCRCGGGGGRVKLLCKLIEQSQGWKAARIELAKQ